MAYTLTQLRTRIMQHADAVNDDGSFSGRWGTTLAGEVDQKLAIVHDREWKRILNANRYYRLSERTPTSSSAGLYAISDLSTASERLYRIVTFIIDNIPYLETKFENLPLASLNNAPYYVWYRKGSSIEALPLAASKQAHVWVNHIPARIIGMANGDSITFPEECEDILALETAALLLSKGGAETGAAAELKLLAEEMRADMLQDISRMSIKPQVVEYQDHNLDWAG